MKPTMNKDTLIVINNDGMGKADLALQHKLLGKYLALLLDAGTLPGAIAFYTDGVKLVTDGSPVLGQLAAMEAGGVRLIVCSTCLEHFGLADKVRVGIVGGMTDIIEAQSRAKKVITL
jgi:intracellular sulfur oxidation DsrE/DsrF family protein